MPLLANYCRKNTAQSRGDEGAERACCCEESKSRSDLSIPCCPNCGDEAKSKSKYEGVGIVKTLLGPSLEDAVIKTLELGKSLVQNSNENELVCVDKTVQKQTKKSCKERCKNHTEKCCKARACGAKHHADCRQGRKRIIYRSQLTENLPLVRKPPRKLSQVSKIRSLDSDLKTSPHSPEKIKKQLEALIQINKDGSTQHARNWDIFSKIPTVPMEMTVMPSVCIYKNEGDLNSSSFDGQSAGRSSCDQSSSNRCESRRLRNRLGAASGICQAPEFISNALGPTLDVSIIDNLKMMRDIFKSDNDRGEGEPVCAGGSKRSSCVTFVESATSKPGSCKQRSPTPPPCPKATTSRESLSCEIKEAEKTIQELQQKQQCLQRQIELEEQERACRRQAFEEEKRRMCEVKACLQNSARLTSTRECSTQKSQCELICDSKLEALKQRIACEEEKLSRLKDQYECYKRELCIAKSRCEAIRRNKCILDAWDVIASRVCHTRLPSFSRAYALEKKEMNLNDPSKTMHCCFPATFPVANKSTESVRSTCPQKCKSQSQCGRDSSLPRSRSKQNICSDCPSTARNCLLAQGEIPFPIQRDVTCGLHQAMKTCSCKPMAKGDAVTCSSDDEVLKKCAGAKQRSTETRAKPACRSKSEVAMGRVKNSKIVQVLWAVARINIFQDNCRTYEIMDATTTPPSSAPVKTEGIFVVRNNPKKSPGSGARRKCTINFSNK